MNIREDKLTAVHLKTKEDNKAIQWAMNNNVAYRTVSDGIVVYLDERELNELKVMFLLTSPEDFLIHSLNEIKYDPQNDGFKAKRWKESIFVITDNKIGVHLSQIDWNELSAKELVEVFEYVIQRHYKQM